jgi:hypothetical protein
VALPAVMPTFIKHPGMAKTFGTWRTAKPVPSTTNRSAPAALAPGGNAVLTIRL